MLFFVLILRFLKAFAAGIRFLGFRLRLRFLCNIAYAGRLGKQHICLNGIHRIRRHYQL